MVRENNPCMDEYLASLNDAARAKLYRDSVVALRDAWAHRHSFRADIVIRANVAMLRKLNAA